MPGWNPFPSNWPLPFGLGDAPPQQAAPMDYSQTTPGGMQLGPPPGVMGTATPANLGRETGSAIGQGVMDLLGSGDRGASGGTPSFQDYLQSLGLGGAFSGANMPSAPDLTGAVQDQYAPILQQLRKGIGRTKKEGKKAGRTLEDIYTGMAAYNKTAGKRIARQGDRISGRIEDLYGNTGAQRDDRIEKESGAIARRAKQLGIRASVPASTERLTKESAQQHRLFARQKGRAVSTAENQAQNWSNFAKSGAIGARMEGAQAQSELQSNVADLVFQMRGQIAQTQADKAAAITQAMAQEYGMQMDQANAQNALAMQKAGLAQDYQGMLMQAQQPQTGSSASGSTADMQGNDLIASLLRNEARQEGGVNQKDASAAIEALGNIIPQVQGSEIMSQTGAATGQYDDPTASQFYQQIPQLAEQAGVSPELIRALLSRQVYEQFYGGS